MEETRPLAWWFKGIRVSAWNGQSVVARHPGGHCFLSVNGTKDAIGQLEALVHMHEWTRKRWRF